MNLNDYNGIVQATANSCGAYALAAGLTSLELKPEETKLERLDTAYVTNGYTKECPHDGPVSPEDRKAVALRLYQVSGVLNLDPPSATYEYDEQNRDGTRGRNAPSALVSLAVSSGCEVEVALHVGTKEVYEAVQVANEPGGTLYGIEYTILEDSDVEPVVSNDWSKPGQEEVQLVLVNDGEHWLAITEDELYDPGNGKVSGYDVQGGKFIALGAKGEIYPFSGMWITLARKNQQPTPCDGQA